MRAIPIGHRFVCLGILFSVSALPVWAQSSSSTVAGLVTDESSTAVPGAQVQIADSATGATQSTLTNDRGRYAIVNVAPGSYEITIRKEGFSVFRISVQKVDVGAVLTINGALKVGSIFTIIEVSAPEGAGLQTNNAAVGATLTAETLALLPNFGRDAATLAILQPGTGPGGNSAGAFPDQNVYMLDGGNNTDDLAGNNNSYVTNFTGTGGTQTGGSSSGVIPTPVESIEEFRVATFNQFADFSAAIGGQIQMVTKRGSNQYHGAAYGYYYATNIGAANSWSNNHTPSAGLPYTPLPSNHRSRFGGSLGGILAPKILGGKTYFFANYEGSRFPNVSTYERTVPSELLRAGVIQVADAAGRFQAYNLNPAPVTVNGVTYNPAPCGTGLCDPRGIGLNPLVKQLWDKYMPHANEFLNQGDLYNTQGYLATIRAPLTQNSYVARIDHDFGERNRFFATYRYMTLQNLTTNQVDIGGALPGTTFGQPAAVAPRVQLPSYWVFGLTTKVRPMVTNDFRFNYTRNFWQWATANTPPQFAGLGGALEIGGESPNALIPYNVNTGGTKQRFWDGQDKLVRDDLTWIKGNHLIQAGGMYQRNYDYFTRTDNGQSINNQPVYQITSANINFGSFAYPGTVPANQQSAFNTYYAQVLGMVAQSQLMYIREGQNLGLAPAGSVASNHSLIPYYNLYATDTWHVKPTITLSYGLSYTVEMPPKERDGKQVMMTYQDGTPVTASEYLSKRQQAALSGQAYQPILGFTAVHQVAGNREYPYDPFYGGWGPRVAVAWNPKLSGGWLGGLFGENKTVLRAGYGRIYGRLNGVNLVLTPMLPPGLLQAVSCPGVGRTGQCAGSGAVDPGTVFRIGIDGNNAPLPAVSQTLPQPYVPGVGGNAGASDITALDTHYRPERTDNVSVTVQRQLAKSMTVEVGYMGRIIRNEQVALNLDSVPYMTTLGGQTLANAFAQAYFATPAGGTLANSFSVPAQAFFESALGGGSSAYCSGFTNCTSAVIVKNTAAIRNTAVSDLWSALYKAPSWTLGRSLLSQPLGAGLGSQGYTYLLNTANGWGNYNALFVSYQMRDFHGVTAASNFTWSKALGTATTAQVTSGTTPLDVYDLHHDYGLQSFDLKFMYNTALNYSPKWFRAQKGVAGRILGGWTFSPLFAAQSGAGIVPGYSEGACVGCQAFGEISTVSSGTVSFSTNAQAASPYTGGSSAHYNVAGSNGTGTNNPTQVNMFADPAAVIAGFRKCILGYDTNCGGYSLRGLPRWNMDLAAGKSVNFWREGVGAEVSVQFTNVFNHTVMGNPALSITTPATFGRITTTASSPRQMEFGMRIHF